MKIFRNIACTIVIAIAIAACNNGEKMKTEEVKTKTQTVGEANEVDINKAMEGMPKFSSPEIQASAEEWFNAFSDGMKEAQQKAAQANGDQAKVKAIASEMSAKFAPWKPKIANLKAKMTAEDKI